MPNKKMQIAVLIGNGGRLPAILECVERLRGKAEVRLVISYKKESPGVELAKEKGIESFCMSWAEWKKAKPRSELGSTNGEGKNRQEFCRELAKIIRERSIDLVVMAGWDVILSKEYFEGFSGKTMNIHPALLPAFAGFHGSEVQREVLRSGVKETGATLHFVVDDGVDTGPIILQEKVPVEEGDTVESLETKIHEKEDEMLCRAIVLFAGGQLRLEGRRVVIIS